MPSGSADNDREPPLDTIRVLGPVVLKSSAGLGAVTGIAGCALGGTAGLMTTSTPVLFSIFSGLQCFTLGASFWATRSAVLIYHARQRDTTVGDVPSTQRLYASTGGGVAAAITTAAIFRGRSNILPGVLAGSLSGFLGQKIHDSLLKNTQQTQPETVKSSFWQSVTDSRLFPMKKLSDEEYANIMKEKLVRVEADIAIIDEDIAQLKETKERQLSEPSGDKS